MKSTVTERVTKLIQGTSPDFDIQEMAARFNQLGECHGCMKMGIIHFWRLQLSAMGLDTTNISSIPINGTDDDFIDKFIVEVMPVIRRMHHCEWYHPNE